MPRRRSRPFPRLVALLLLLAILIWLSNDAQRQQTQRWLTQTFASWSQSARLRETIPRPPEASPTGISPGFVEEPGNFTVADRLAQYGPAARARLAPFFHAADQPWPPARIQLVGLKAERQLEVWTAASPSAPLTMVRRYPILGASGGPGPKLREGDLQVPEGLYPIVSLNPNSAIHLSMRIGYPSAEDARHARAESRNNLGGDIMIHGGSGSTGCLAIGNPAIEELFVLVAETGVENTQIILSPVDFRRRELPAELASLPSWMPARYDKIRSALKPLDYQNPPD